MWQEEGRSARKMGAFLLAVGCSPPLPISLSKPLPQGALPAPGRACERGIRLWRETAVLVPWVGTGSDVAWCDSGDATPTPYSFRDRVTHSFLSSWKVWLLPQGIPRTLCAELCAALPRWYPTPLRCGAWWQCGLCLCRCVFHLGSEPQRGTNG